MTGETNRSPPDCLVWTSKTLSLLQIECSSFRWQNKQLLLPHCAILCVHITFPLLRFPLVNSSNCWRAFQEPSSLSSSAVDSVPLVWDQAQRFHCAGLCHWAEALLIGGNGCFRETNHSQDSWTELHLSPLSHYRYVPLSRERDFPTLSFFIYLNVFITLTFPWHYLIKCTLMHV